MKKSVLKHIDKEVFFNFANTGPCFGTILSYDNPPMVEIEYIMHDGKMMCTKVHENHLQNIRPLDDGLKQYVLNGIKKDNERAEKVKRINEGKKVINEIRAKLEELDDIGVYSFAEKDCNYKGKAMVHYFNNLDIVAGDEFLIKEIEFPPDEDAIIAIGRFHHLEISSLQKYNNLSLQFHPYIYRVL